MAQCTQFFALCVFFNCALAVVKRSINEHGEDITYYELLGVSRDASLDEIKKGFREVSLKYHPDKNPSPQAEEMYKEISFAYETLSDENNRFMYDELGVGYHKKDDRVKPKEPKDVKKEPEVEKKPRKGKRVFDKDGWDITYYELLGVARTASLAEIKKAFRQVSMKYHPDKNPDPEAAEIFKEMSFAYETLSDEDKRFMYDQIGVGYHNNPNAADYDKPRDQKLEREHTQDTQFKGCYDKNGPVPVDTSSHVGCSKPEVCASLALRAGKLHFALLNPQSCGAGQAECLPLDSCCPITRVPDFQCPVKATGYNLGGEDRLAVYEMPEDFGKDEPGYDAWESRERRKKHDEDKAKAESKKEEQMKTTPWLLAPEVKEVQQRIERLTESRRSANANFDFELSAKRSKEINEAERELKKVIKKAKKAYKKSVKKASGSTEVKVDGEDEDTAKGSKSDL